MRISSTSLGAKQGIRWPPVAQCFDRGLEAPPTRWQPDQWRDACLAGVRLSQRPCAERFRWGGCALLGSTLHKTSVCLAAGRSLAGEFGNSWNGVLHFLCERLCWHEGRIRKSQRESVTAPFLGTAAAKPALASSQSTDAEGSSDAAAVLLTGRDTPPPSSSPLFPSLLSFAAFLLILVLFPALRKRRHDETQAQPDADVWWWGLQETGSLPVFQERTGRGGKRAAQGHFTSDRSLGTMYGSCVFDFVA